MADLVSITLPIFLVIGLGFGAVRFGVVNADIVRGIGVFTLNFLMPALILHALLSQDLRSTFSWQYVVAYAAGSMVIFLPTWLLFRTILRRDGAVPAIVAMGSTAANSGFVGFPVATLAIGAPALVALPLSMIVETTLVIPLALGLAEASLNGQASRLGMVRDAVLRVVRMPITVAIGLGIVLSLAGVHLPIALTRTIDMLANAATACALFTVGGTLAATRGPGLSGDIAWIVAAKLLLHPLAVACAFWLVGGVDPGLMAAGILLAASPMLTAYPIFAQRFGLSPFAATALLATTAVSFLTLTAAIALVRPG